MSTAAVVQDSKSRDLYVLAGVKENGSSPDKKTPDKARKNPTLMMPQLQLHSDANMNRDSRLGNSEAESPQSLGGDSQMSFNVYEGRLSGSVTSLGELPKSASTTGFLPECSIKGRMVSWYSRRIRQLSVLLSIFVILSVVMTGLFIWRMAYSTQSTTTGRECANCGRQTGEAQESKCPVRARAVPLPTLPKSITDQLSKIEKRLSKAVNRIKGSVMANIVYMDRVIWTGVFGRMNESDPTAPKLSNHTVFPIASGTKILTALMLYKLHYEKKIKSLDEPLVKYIPGFSVTDPFNSHDIVLREIVSHMSGLPREAPCFPKTKTSFCAMNNSVMLERIKQLKLVVRPGSEAYYSNLGFGLLGRGLANSQNTTYEDWIQENIFNPLGMRDSGFKLTPELRRKIPEGYIHKLPQQPMEWGWLSATGGLFTSLVDVAKLEMKLFNSTEENDFLSPLITEEFFSPAFILQDDQFVGSPWEMSFKNGYLTRKKSGYVYGYQSSLMLFPELKLAMNIFNTGDTIQESGTLSIDLLTVFHDVLRKRDIQSQPRLSAENVTPYLGEFGTNDVPTINVVNIDFIKGELFFVVNHELHFHLNYLKGTTFEILDRRAEHCLKIFVLGVNHEKIHFDDPLNTTNRSPGFTIFGIHISGKAYFHRKHHS